MPTMRIVIEHEKVENLKRELHKLLFEAGQPNVSITTGTNDDYPGYAVLECRLSDNSPHSVIEDVRMNVRIHEPIHVFG